MPVLRPHTPLVERLAHVALAGMIAGIVLALLDVRQGAGALSSRVDVARLALQAVARLALAGAFLATITAALTELANRRLGSSPKLGRKAAPVLLTAVAAPGLIYLAFQLFQGGMTSRLPARGAWIVAVAATLLALFDEGPLSPSQIARRIMVKSSTVTGIIDRLEKKGLVVRMRNSPDRRVITIELTESGRELAEIAPPPIQHKIVDGLKRLVDTEKEEIIQSLSKLTEMIDAQELEVETESEYL